MAPRYDSHIREWYYTWIFTACVRSTYDGRLCFHRCVSVQLSGVGGVSSPRSVGGGYPIPGLWVGGIHPRSVGEGTPSQVCGWGGTQSQVWVGGTMSQVWVGGTPSQVWVGGTPSQVWMVGGYPGYPLARSGWWGVPWVPPAMTGWVPPTMTG